MNYILIEGHNVRHDLRELFRIVFNNEEYTFINDLESYPNVGKLFISSLKETSNGRIIISKYYKDGKKIKWIEENVEKTEVYIENSNKKINVAVKKGLLKTFEEIELPWGILTGIRPSKIVHDLLDEEISVEEIKRVLNKEYLISKDKVNLLVNIVLKQRKHLKGDKNEYSLYISIPFCPTRCLYCSFPSLDLNRYEDEVNNYIETLLYEIDETIKLLEGKEVKTIYIGGGTPTSISSENLEKIIKKLREYFGDKPIEWTVEAGRPDTLNKNYLEMLKNNKIDRISINPQTMNDKTLEVIGRSHSVDDIRYIYDKAKELEFKVINMDLIIGLPGEDKKDILNSLKEIIKLNPENITIHTLAVKRASRFNKTIDEYEVLSEEKMLAIMEEVQEKLFKAGYEPYYLYRQKNSIGNLENVGYSKKGLECIYNISMMEERETIIALGFGGVSKIYMGNGKIKRVPNFKGYHDYMSRIDELIENKNKALKSLDFFEK